MKPVKAGLKDACIGEVVARFFILMLLLGASPALVQAQSGPESQRADGDKALFGDLPAIDSVSLHAQTLAEAPANVTVITAADIRRYGYRTLADALASVRGFYVTYDHEYHYVGVSGISLPGDFNTRFLVMLNGHPLTDNIYNSNGFFGQDFGLDMDLVDRIEIIRGPTSALYGSNGVLANINIVTRSPVDADRLRASAETDSAGQRKLSLAASMNLGRGANLLISASVFNNLGVPFATSGLAVLPGTPNVVPNADGERGYHTFANLIWHNWSFIAYFNSRLKQTPIGVGTSFNGDPAQHAVDGRSFLGAFYKRSAGPGQLLWQIFYDRYRYQDRYGYPAGNAVDTVRDFNFGDWIDSAHRRRLRILGSARPPVQPRGRHPPGRHQQPESRRRLLRPAGMEALDPMETGWRCALRRHPLVRQLPLAPPGAGLAVLAPHRLQTGLWPALPQSQRLRAVL